MAELGGLLGRPPDSLYYHMRRLLQVGLVAGVGTRLTGGRSETVFQPVHDRAELHHDPADPANRRQIRAAVRSSLRLTERDLVAALRSGQARTAPGERNFYTSRVTGWLTPEQKDAVLERLREVEAILQESKRNTPRPADLFAVTMTLCPLTPQSRAPARRRNERQPEQ